MVFGRDAETIIQRVQMKNTLELIHEGNMIKITLERAKVHGDQDPITWPSWLKGVWLSGVYEREIRERNLQE